MKQFKKIIPFVIILFITLIVGYFLRKNRMVYNYGDTYYVVDYFTISKLISVLLVILALILLIFKKLTARKRSI